MNWATCLTYLRPEASWEIIANDYDTLKWYGPGEPPSRAELEAVWPAANYQQQKAIVDANRHTAYVAEADPLFFQYQRGEVTEQVWLDKVSEIRSRFPEPPNA